jgi:hypothetical protein
MESIQVGHLKSEFSAILHRIQENGEMFIIKYGRSHKKIAMLIPYQESLEHKKPRTFGVLKNRASFTLSKDFDMTDDEFLGSE